MNSGLESLIECTNTVGGQEQDSVEVLKGTEEDWLRMSLSLIESKQREGDSY